MSQPFRSFVASPEATEQVRCDGGRESHLCSCEQRPLRFRDRLCSTNLGAARDGRGLVPQTRLAIPRADCGGNGRTVSASQGFESIRTWFQRRRAVDDRPTEATAEQHEAVSRGAWYADPYGSATDQRWWDGAKWTDEVRVAPGGDEPPRVRIAGSSHVAAARAPAQHAGSNQRRTDFPLRVQTLVGKELQLRPTGQKSSERYELVASDRRRVALISLHGVSELAHMECAEGSCTCESARPHDPHRLRRDDAGADASGSQEQWDVAPRKAAVRRKSDSSPDSALADIGTIALLGTASRTARGGWRPSSRPPGAAGPGRTPLHVGDSAVARSTSRAPGMAALQGDEFVNVQSSLALLGRPSSGRRARMPRRRP
jgi:hypothetical protein